MSVSHLTNMQLIASQITKACLCSIDTHLGCLGWESFKSRNKKILTQEWHSRIKSVATSTNYFWPVFMARKKTCFGSQNLDTVNTVWTDNTLGNNAVKLYATDVVFDTMAWHSNPIS